jgi:signal transduction histidine kinase
MSIEPGTEEWARGESKGTGGMSALASGSTGRDGSSTSVWPRLPIDAPPGARLELVHTLLADGAGDRAKPVLEAARAYAQSLFRAGGETDATDRLAAVEYTAAVLVELAAEGDLDAADVTVACEALAAARSESVSAASFELAMRALRSAALLELPPIVAAEIQLRLLVQLGVTEEISLWRGSPAGGVDCMLALGGGHATRRVRASAKAALRERPSLSILGSSSNRTARVLRFGRPHAVIVATVRSDQLRSADAYLSEAATALGPVLEREHLLARSAERERTLVQAGEKRLMRLGFDLHDGPVQEVLSLAEDVRQLRDQVYPFVLESHRELARGRFDDLLARLAELDRQMREIAHSLESRSVVSRPLSEVLHREVDAFVERSGIDVRLEIKGDAESLTPSARIAIFRAIQESLANVREHSGATEVAITVRMRRSGVDVKIVDNGTGFEVARALARAAQRGRLGLVGLGERVQLLGGTFEVDSAPGGPTTIRFTLPRWDRFAHIVDH